MPARPSTSQFSWLGETLASYIHPLNAVEAQAALAAAAHTVSQGWVAVDPDVRLVGYQLGAAFTGVAMGASRSVWGDAVDEIVRVGRAWGLGGALGDLDLRIGFESASGAFVAVDGAPVSAEGSQVVTDFDLGADGHARVVHRPGLLEDRRVRRDVETAAHLLAAHRRLTAEVQQGSADVGASRARLVVAEDRAGHRRAGRAGGSRGRRSTAAARRWPRASAGRDGRGRPDRNRARPRRCRPQ